MRKIVDEDGQEMLDGLIDEITDRVIDIHIEIEKHRPAQESGRSQKREPVQHSTPT